MGFFQHDPHQMFIMQVVAGIVQHCEEKIGEMITELF